MNVRKKGLTPEQYDQKWRDQQGVCASCGEPETRRNQYGVLRLAIDTDHSTGQPRGLLCMLCNRALGMLRDDPVVVENLLSYRRGFD